MESTTADNDSFLDYTPECEENVMTEVNFKMKVSFKDFEELNKQIGRLLVKESKCSNLTCELKEYAQLLRSLGEVTKSQVLVLMDVSRLLLSCGPDTVERMLGALEMDNV